MGPTGTHGENVVYEVLDDTAWVTMNRPNVLNALSKGMFKELKRAIQIAARDPKVFTVGIRGSGRAFSAGLDVREVSGFTSRKEAGEFVYDLVKPFWDYYLKCDKPILSVVDGPAYGAGAEIALAADIVIATARSNFAFSGGRVGALCCISAAFGQATMIGRKVVEMNLTGTPVNAEEAHSLGLVNYVEESDGLNDRVQKVLAEMRHVSPISNASFKRIHRTLFSTRTLNVAYRELLRTITSKDFKEGAAAFAQKKAANYRL
jgi:enoyl-CoA hydratase / 3-hydroxyacyl-CoA dehydrogenase